MAFASNNMGLVHWYLGDLSKAIRHYRTSIQLKEAAFRELTNQDEKYKVAVSLSGSYNDIGLVYWDAGMLKDSLENYNKSLKMKKQVSDLWGIGVVLGNIGLVYMDLDKIDEAIRYIGNALEIRKYTGDEWAMANAYNALAEAFLNKGDTDKAFNFAAQSMQIRKKIDDKRGIDQVRLVMGNILLTKKETQQALRYYESVKNSRMNDVRIAALRGIGSANMNRGQFVKALSALNKSIALAKQKGFAKEEAKAKSELAKLYARTGESEKAKVLFAEVKNFFDKMKS